MSVSDDGDSAQALSSIQSPARIGLIRSHPRSGFNLSLGSVVDDVSSVREDPPAEHGEEGEVDEGPDDDGSFVFAPKKLSFQQDFRYFAIPAAEYCGFEVPPPVQLPNAALPSGDVFADDEMDSAVELRYPEARSHVEAFLRPFTKTVSHSLSTSLVKAREATLVPFFKTMMDEGVPRPEDIVSSYLTDVAIVPKTDGRGKGLPVAFSLAKKPVHECGRRFADTAWKASAQVAALNSSAALLSTSVERMARLGAQADTGGVVVEPKGLTPAQCQAVYEQMRLINSTLLSVAQTAGFLAAQSVVATRTIWLDFVRFRGKAAPGAADLRTIASADVDGSSLFGSGLESILANRETFLDRRSAMEDILERKPEPREARPSTSDSRTGDGGRARSPQARSRSGPAYPSRGRSASRGDREKGKGFRPPQPYFSYGKAPQQEFQRRDEFRGGRGRGGRGQSGPTRNQGTSYNFTQRSASAPRQDQK